MDLTLPTTGFRARPPFTTGEKSGQVQVWVNMYNINPGYFLTIAQFFVNLSLLSGKRLV